MYSLKTVMSYRSSVSLFQKRKKSKKKKVKKENIEIETKAIIEKSITTKQ